MSIILLQRYFMGATLNLDYYDGQDHYSDGGIENILLDYENCRQEDQ